MKKLLDVEREGDRGEFVIYTARNHLFLYFFQYNSRYLCLCMEHYKLIHNKSILYLKIHLFNESFQRANSSLMIILVKFTTSIMPRFSMFDSVPHKNKLKLNNKMHN